MTNEPKKKTTVPSITEFDPKIQKEFVDWATRVKNRLDREREEALRMENEHKSTSNNAEKEQTIP